MDEDTPQRRIYFITFVESLEMIFSQYTETCEVLLDYPGIGGQDIQYFSKKDIRNILHTNIDVHSRILISEFPSDGIKCIEKLQLHCANMNVSDKSIYDRIFSKSHIKEGNLQLITLKYYIMHRLYKFMQKIPTHNINGCTHFWITFTKVENILLKQLATRYS